jgi:hypothetical protein
MKMNRVIAFLVSGALCFYQYDQGETALLEKIQQLSALKDCEGKAATTSQGIVCMAVVRADSRDEWIPPVDTEVFNEQMHLNALSDVLQMDLKANLLKKIKGTTDQALETQEYLVFVSPCGSLSVCAGDVEGVGVLREHAEAGQDLRARDGEPFGHHPHRLRPTSQALPDHLRGAQPHDLVPRLLQGRPQREEAHYLVLGQVVPGGQAPPGDPIGHLASRHRRCGGARD